MYGNGCSNGRHALPQQLALPSPLGRQLRKVVLRGGFDVLTRAVECQVLERECYVQLERFLLPRAPPAGPEEGGEPEVPPAPAWA